jgi:hypothetical protein
VTFLGHPYTAGRAVTAHRGLHPINTDTDTDTDTEQGEPRHDRH